MNLQLSPDSVKYNKAARLLRVLQKGLFLVLLCSLHAQEGNPVVFTVQDTVYHTISPDFFGIQYHSQTYSDQTALAALSNLNLKWIRVWAEVSDFHPQPGEWRWDELDSQINEIVSAGYVPLPCLWGEKWFVGSADTAWWNFDTALAEWEKAAFELASRYKTQLRKIIVFDELNMLHPEEDYYIPFKDAAKLYIRAARNIKAAKADMRCGGPSAFGGWENGYWANYVLDEPDGAELLDFISSNTFLSWDASDSDHQVLARTIWYEEVPLNIRDMLGGRAYPELVLDAYNLSALWSLDGQPWTDPRNTNLIGGIYQAAALMHSAKGGFDLTLHWETLGGYGVLSWFPKFEKLAPYYSWKFLSETAGLTEGAQIIGCATDAAPDTSATHLGGMNVFSYPVQPFAIRRSDGGISVVLINKQAEDTSRAAVNIPSGMPYYRLYRYDRERMSASSELLQNGLVDSVLNVEAPPYSVTVVCFDSVETVGMPAAETTVLQRFALYQNYPNPFNGQTDITYNLPQTMRVRLLLFDIRGRQVRDLQMGEQTAGMHRLRIDMSEFSSGVYFYRLQAGKISPVRKMIYLR